MSSKGPQTFCLLDQQHQHGELAGKWGHFSACVFVLLKKQFFPKFWTLSSILELLGAMILPLFIPFVWFVGHDLIQANPNPEFDVRKKLGYDLGTFLVATGNATFIIMPNNSETNFLVQDLFAPYFGKFEFKIQYVDEYSEMEKLIYKNDANGVGIHWVNSASPDAETNPDIRLYLQTMYGSPSVDLFRLIRMAIALKHRKYSLAMFETHTQKFSAPKMYDDIPLEHAIMIFALWPIFLSVMPDIQNVLDERENKLFALFILMGMPESAYWLVVFLSAVLISIIPYTVVTLVLCYIAGFIGTSFWFVFTLNLLFVVSHVSFLFFILTFIKKASHGQMFIIIFLVLSVFTSFVHKLFTLSENNVFPYAKEIFSLVPFSAYQMLMADICTKEAKYERAVGWDDLYLKSQYPIGMGIKWLAIDAAFYFVGFLFFNLVLSRNYGFPLLGWRGFFSFKAWKNMFCRSPIEVSEGSTTMIKVRELSKTYKGVQETKALDNVSFSIGRGEKVVVIGPNGAGKSTLINILSGTIESTAGEIEILGSYPTNRFQSIQDYIGICFQENVLVDGLTCKQNIELFATFRGLSILQYTDFISRYSSCLQLDHVLDTLSRNLSGGQKRKLCIAISFLGNPPFIIMDEPTAGVDIQSRIAILKTLSELDNTSILITCHSLDEAETISQRIMIVSKGNIPFSGSSTELRKQYKCGYILKYEQNEQNHENILNLVQKIIPEATQSNENPNMIRIPVVDEASDLVTIIENQKESLGIISFSFSVEQLEDMLIKMIQEEECTVPSL